MLCGIIGGFWLLDSLKDTVLATTVGLEWQPKAKLASVAVTLFVVAAYNALIRVAAKPTLFSVFGLTYACIFVVPGGLPSRTTICKGRCRRRTWTCSGRRERTSTRSTSTRPTSTRPR